MLLEFVVMFDELVATFVEFVRMFDELVATLVLLV